MAGLTRMHCSNFVGKAERQLWRSWGADAFKFALIRVANILMKAGATAVWPVAAGAIGWVLLRKYGEQPQGSQLGSEGA
jgi:hypothetical protein